MPREVTAVACEVLRELVDAAFRQSDALAGQVWRPAGRQAPCAVGEGPDGLSPLPAALRKPGVLASHCVTLRGADGGMAVVLNPVLPLATLWLLRMPNRSIQVRFTDSGEADELIPELDLDAIDGEPDRVRARWRMNDHPLSTKGRRQGVIRRIDSPGLDWPLLGFYVNTNKSQEGGHADGADRGLEIPWEDAEMHMALYRLRGWQTALNPVDRLLARGDLYCARVRPSDGLKGSLPRYAYLFRHLQDRDLAGRLEPPDHNQLFRFFRDLLDEVEARLADGPASRSADGSQRSPPRIVLSRAARTGRARLCAYSPGCARPTGLTALKEAGVPFWILSSIVAGHQTPLMTLYYVKPSARVIVDALAKARSAMDGGALRDEADDAATRTPCQLAARFVSDGHARSDEGHQVAGLWLPMHDGICPNGATLCHRGGPAVDGTGVNGPVPGSARNCVLCRFFLTGPGFLGGQVLLINATLYEARRRALGLQALWIERRAPANEARRGQYDDRIARAEEELDLKFRAVNARVRLLHKSLALADLDEAGLARGPGTPPDGDLLLTRMGAGDVEAALQAVGDLGSWTRSAGRRR